MKKLLSLIAVIGVIAGAALFVPGNAQAASADLVVYGKIFTSEGSEIVEAFAVKDGKYVYIGSKEGAEAFVEVDCARQMFLEDERGSIRAGKYADFLLVNKDVLTCPVMEIHTAKPEATYFEGKKVYEAPRTERPISELGEELRAQYGENKKITDGKLGGSP